MAIVANRPRICIDWLLWDLVKCGLAICILRFACAFDTFMLI
ncbi:hypothetical protein HMPREF1583_00141 [Gardnerella vaginalis JCP8151B]|nr:hypothetical protein HMPREF1583_00141 [Gardnerella vaginalis JCP8151B]